MFEAICAAAGLMEPIAEFRFAPPRKFRFDFCWPEVLLALECEGGVWTGGRHTRPAGFLRDIQKYNLAAMMGYRILRCTPKDMKNGNAVLMVKEFMERPIADLHAKPKEKAS